MEVENNYWWSVWGAFSSSRLNKVFEVDEGGGGGLTFFDAWYVGKIDKIWSFVPFFDKVFAFLRFQLRFMVLFVENGYFFKNRQD